MPTSNPTKNPTASPTSASDTTCHICPSGSIQYPGTHRCFARKWSGFLCNLDPATDPAKHHANDPKCVCSGPIFDVSSAEGQCMSGNYDMGTVLRQKAHTIHVELSVPTSFNSQSRQWILNLGQWNTGAHHWIWNSNSQIQFGRWNGEQIQTFDIRVCNSLTMVVEPSTQMKLFCKGQLVGTHQGSVPFDVQNANLAVASNPQEQGFTGCVKQVKIWSRALTYSEVQQQVSTDTDTTCRACPSGTIQYPGTHRCFERKWSGFVCNLDPATDPAKHHANDRKCVCSAFTTSTTQTPTSNPTRTPTRDPTGSPTKMPTSNPTRNPTASPTSASDTTCHICPSGSIQYPGTHRCFARKWSGFLCNLDPATDPAKHHANDPKCVCSATSSPTATPTLTPTSNPSQNPTATPTQIPTSNPSQNPTATPTQTPTSNPSQSPTATPTQTPTSNPSQNPSASPNCQSSFLSYNGKCYGTVDWNLQPEPVRFNTPVSSSADNCDIEEWHEI